MKRDFTNENFERFLKQSADNLRMKAPDKVWQNLSRELNKRRRRFVFGLSAFLFITSAVGYFTISNLPEQGYISQQLFQQETAVNIPKQNNNSYTENSTQPTTNNFSAEDEGEISITPIATKKITGDQQVPFTAPLEDIALNGKATDLPGGHNSDENDFTPTVVDSYTEFDNQESVESTVKQNQSTSTTDFPLTIESVINAYRLKSKKSKFETQFYFAPTVSYRKLTENKSYLRTLDPAAVPGNYPALYSNVNNNVTHKPDIGFELGFATKYALSKKLKLRAGVQFNVNRYNVKAFSSPLAIATIALNNGTGFDSLNTISSYSNVNGYKSNWLKNLSFQISAPVGVEFTIKENDKIQFGIGSTIQPTYVLGDRAFLITTDYKNYTEVPWLIRRWNVNTSLETFVIYNAGKTTWQVGPQVRYQLLSSFISEYPVKENLFDFGLKVGVSLNK